MNNECIDTFEQIEIGQTEEFFHRILESDIDTFCNLTGDDNPLHMDDNYASKTNFKERVVHGMLTASFISTMIGTRIPGKGALWYEQHIKFLAPVRIGDEIRVWAKVLHKSETQRIVVLETVIYNQHGKKVIDGEAKVKIVNQLSSENPQMINNNESISNHKGAVIITGAATGIGAATAIRLAKEGYGIIVNYRNHKNHAEQVVEKILDFGGRAMAVQADVTNKDSVDAMVSTALESYDTIEGVVNNASAPIDYLSFEDMTWSAMQLHFDVQILGAFNLSKAVLPHFLESQKGSIVNISSIYADNVPPVKMMHYTLAKTALVSFTKSLAVELGPKGIRVNCVAPGMTSTDMISDIPEKAKMVTKMMTPLRRLAQPEDVSASISFLIGEQSKYITGETIRVCGGQVMI